MSPTRIHDLVAGGAGPGHALDEARARGVHEAVAALRRGAVVLVPTETRYALLADAFREDAVARLAEVKGVAPQAVRTFAVGVGRRGAIDGIAASLGPAARTAIEAFWPGPLTLVCHQQPTLAWPLGRAGDAVAVRMPLDRAALAVLAALGPCVMTGVPARAGTARPGVEEAEHVAAVLPVLAAPPAVALDAGPRSSGATSTVVDVRADPPRLVRPGLLGLVEIRAALPDVTASEARSRGES